MKRIWIIIVNVVIMILMLIFVALYTYFDNSNTIKRQIEHFENTTITMEHVTENYLEGEQRICDVWANHINNNNMTIEEAISFIRDSHVLKNTSAHIVYLDDLTGLSTRSSIIEEMNYSVSYSRMELLNDLSWISPIGESINVSRAYTNPLNGEQSIAFCNFINLNDGINDRDAILLRILPISELKEKWVFPQEEFKKAELSIIDSNGDYIIKGHSFKNSSFFEFYRSYNSIDPVKADEFFDKISSSTGSFTMLNSKSEECILAYTPFDVTGGWTLLSFMPMEYLSVNNENWILIGTISLGLLVLFLFDLTFMIYFNKKLEATAKEASLANKAKTDFLSTMSHDIRTPMNAIIGFTTLAKKNIDDKNKVDDNLRKITLASNHLLTLINDILDISKVESGKLSLSPQKFSIVETVENLMNISMSLVKEKNLEFSFNVSNIENEILYADKLRLNQIFINILSNAIKYTEPNGKVMVLMKEELREKEECVRLIYRVSDTGIGMSPEFMLTMYDAFSRQTDSRVNSIQGTGLGLAITKKMVDLMGGKIECESEQEKGTTFTVTLDIPFSMKNNDIHIEDTNILIIDNDNLLADEVNTLKSLGLNVDSTNSYLDYINMINEKIGLGNEYNVLIIDSKANDIKLDEFINKIRQITNTPILLISNYDTDIEIDINKIENVSFLKKPLFKSTLYEKINEILGVNKSNDSINDYSDLNGLNILVAEDYDINYEIISTYLSIYGITTERALNGSICVEKIKEAKPNTYILVFMDIQMPIMNGLDATRAIRKLDDESKKNIPIIAMTSDAFSENITECLNAGMNGHIAKPIDINIVLKEIRRIKEELNYEKDS
jgi:signal transduction histidine kinase/DNA-binding response OmpR family regulator